MKNQYLKKWLTLSALFLYVCFSPHMLLRAQSTANYAFSTNTTGSLGLDMNGNTVDMSTGTTQLVAADLDDQVSSLTSLGFNFNLMGVAYNQFYATSNGVIQLGATAPSSSLYTLSGGSVASPRLGALAADLRTGISGKVHFKIVGSAPNRCLVVEFLNMSLTYVASPGSNDGTYQVRLYEASGVIEYIYGSMFRNASTTTTAAIYSGFSVNTTANTLASITTSSNTASTGATFNLNSYTNSANIPNLHSATEGSRRIYRFTPPVPAAPSSLLFSSIGSSFMTLSWTDNSSNELGFIVSRSTDGVTYTNVSTTAANATSYIATGLTPGTLYYWKITPFSEGASGTPVSGTQSTLSCASISGIKTVGTGGDYPNLTTAFSDINSCTLSGNTELQLIAGYPASAETYPITASTTAAVGSFTIKLYPMVSGLSITSGNTTGTLNLNNTANLTIDGRVNQTGANDLIIANTNAGTSYAILLNNDAQNNTIKNAIIQSVNTSSSSGTIVIGTTTGTNGNDNNTIDNCDIKDGATTPANAIYSVGSTGTAAQYNDNITISNNRISNFFNAANSTIGVFAGNGNNAWTITNNKLFQTATRTYTSGNTHNGIQVNYTSGNGFVITGNTIGFATSTGTGTYTLTGAATRFVGINVSAGTTIASSIQGNTISGINLTSTSGASGNNGVFSGIYITNGNVNVGNTTPNVIGSTTGTGAITVTGSTTGGLVLGINSSSAGALNISNNQIGSITANGSSASVSVGITGIQVTAGTPTINGNTIGSTVTANSINSPTVSTNSTGQLVRGIDVTSGVTATTSIQSNTIANLNQNATGSASNMRGLSYAGSGLATISLNTIYNISTAGSGVLSNIGILHGGAATTGAIINKNTVYTISNTNTGSNQTNVIGIGYGGPTSGSITGNVIYDIRNASTMTVATTPPVVSGILVQATVNISNNMISLGNGQTTNTEFIGIWNNITSTGAINCYHNSVSISGTAASGALPSYAIMRGANTTTAVTSTIDIRNNIFSNLRSGGTGKHYAIGNQSATASTVGWGTNASNYNVLNTTNTATVGLWGATDETFNAWRLAANSDANSYSALPLTFTDITTANLHLNMGATATPIESGGTTIAAVTTDIDNQNRPGPSGSVNGGGTSPDLGADEFDGVPALPIITLNSITPPATTQCTGSARVVSANITTPLGTIASVNIGYTVNGVTQTPITMTNTGGNTWTGTIPVPTPANGVIAWGISATNTSALSSSYVGTPYFDEPLLGVVGTVSASTASTCAGSSSTLTAKISGPGSASIGTGATTLGTTSTGEALSPFTQYYEGQHTQYLVLASDLTAAGIYPGALNALSLNVTTKNSTLPFTSFNIKLASTSLTSLTNGNNSATFTNVYASSTTLGSGYSTVAGLNTFAFGTGSGTSATFTWDGTSNILVDICFANDPTTSGSYYSNTDVVAANTKSYTATYGYYADNSSLCGGTNANTSSSVKVPNFIFSGTVNRPITSVSWSDGVGTVGTTNPVTVTPSATTTYTATITSAGCPVTPAPTTTVTVNPLPTAPTATNSAQCGVQVPTASVASTTGLPTPTFNWYAASSGGSALQSSTSTTYTSTVGTTTTFYVSELNSTTGCESPRTPVTINVSSPDPVAVVASPTSVCLGSSFTLTGSNTNGTPFQNYTYSFQSSTTGSGAETAVAGNPATITPTAAGTFVYTVTGVDGGCAATSTVSVVIKALPVISSATATPATVCSGDAITLTGTSIGVGPGTATIGTQTTTDYVGSVYRFGYGAGDFRQQLVYTAAELTAAGIQAGNITSIAFNVTSLATGTAANNYIIKIGGTNATGVTATFLTDPTTPVFNAATFAPVAGINTHTFSTPFNWNGTSNILIDICFTAPSGGGSSYVAMSTPASTSNVELLGSTGACSASGGGTTYTLRPLATFGGQTTTNIASSLNWTWTPGGFNTAVASTSISNSTGSDITQAFTVTATNTTTGCSNTTTTAPVTIKTALSAPIAVNSTQCGQGVPTASVTGSGAPGNTFSWYLVSSGGTAISGQTGNTLSGYSINTTTTFYVAENNGTCTGPRTAVTVTVTPAPTISVSGTATICNGSSTSLTASSSNDPNYTYTWSGGLGTGATVSASPSANTTYTVTATDASGGTNNGCVTSTTYMITVNPVPVSYPITPATATICEGTVQQLTSGPAVAAGTAIYGTGTTAPGTTSYPNPLSAYYGGAKHQILFTAAELTAQGLFAGSKINSVAFDVNAFAANACTNFTIRMGNTASTALTGFVGGTTNVYGPTTFTPSAAGIVTFTLTTPYTWDGTSNIVVETVHNAGNSGNGSGTVTNTTTTVANTVYYGAKDNVSGGIAGFDALSSWSVSGASNLRPNVRFAFTNIVPTWTPISTLYTNTGATTAYAGTNVSTVYAKPLTTTTYVATYTGSNGCTSQSTATITVNHPSTNTITATACSSYTLNTTTYTASGTYVQHLTNAVGCDSAITLNLTINQPTTATLTQTACSSYTLNGSTYTASGTYTQVLTGANAVGCDSTITLNLTINQPTTSTLTQTACSSYTLNGSTYTTSGTYVQHLTNAAGCDSAITLNLTINQPTTATVNGVGCNSYTYNGVTYNVSGTYTQILPNAVGCDSVVTVNVALTNSYDTINATACSSYTYNSVLYTASGTYSQVLTNMFGCDSTIVLNLTINQPTTSTLTQTACGSYTLNGSSYTSSGTYIQHLTNAAGCDSMITLNLTINQPTTSTIMATACGSYTLNGTQYNTSGTYTQVLTGANAAGCDSTITLNLTINQPTTATVTVTTCDSYVWAQNGQTYNTSGMYNDTIANAAGCDSIITLNLTINHSTSSTLSFTNCGTFTFYGTPYATSGTYTQTIPNVAGCDSVVTLNIVINQPTTATVTASSCGSYTWAQNGMTYNTSGMYNDTIPNAAGCDSIIILNLTINQAATGTFTHTACGSYTWIDGVTYTTSNNTATHTIPGGAASGCDSIVTLHLTINPLPVATATVNSNATITASSGSAYQWINCTTGLAITGATAQTFAPSANGSYAVVVSNGSGCSDTSTCVTVNNVGIMENTSVSIAVYPNPTHNEVTITMDAASATIEVVDAQGKLLQTTQVISGGKVDLSTYETGVYFLRINTEYGSTLERIVKN